MIEISPGKDKIWLVNNIRGYLIARSVDTDSISHEDLVAMEKDMLKPQRIKITDRDSYYDSMLMYAYNESHAKEIFWEEMYVKERWKECLSSDNEFIGGVR